MNLNSLLLMPRQRGRLKCTSALNLDGGGSTAQWLKGQGVVNRPSDREGERPVSDIVFVGSIKTIKK